MVKLFTYTGKGSIEFSLRSSNRRVRLESGASIAMDCNTDDLRIFRALNKLGIAITDVKKEPVKEPEVISEPAPVEVPVEVKPEAVSEPEVESPVESSDAALAKLMKNSRTQLLNKADSLGIVVPDGASKRDIAKLILDK